LDDKDLEFAEALQNLRVPRSVAMLITFLANTDEATSREIERGTGMRHPEVSIGMRTLRNHNWLNEREIKAERKGRPMKVYKLTVPIDKIIQHYEELENSESARTMQAIQRLKEMAAT
jgi:predicted transcriptional regulator